MGSRGVNGMDFLLIIMGTLSLCSFALGILSTFDVAASSHDAATFFMSVAIWSVAWMIFLRLCSRGNE